MKAIILITLSFLEYLGSYAQQIADIERENKETLQIVCFSGLKENDQHIFLVKFENLSGKVLSLPRNLIVSPPNLNEGNVDCEIQMIRGKGDTTSILINSDVDVSISPRILNEKIQLRLGEISLHKIMLPGWIHLEKGYYRVRLTIREDIIDIPQGKAQSSWYTFKIE